ncbi:hypothetical protein BVC80_1831g275 [Macleaya cordata]|uniref:Uncharacterized protein n=1 Tax=Macleaya cordata TaxID=56857 RepID=A0A200R7M5_MACCD|nr:hypothetical protein BVC80_1831g275 [Macleaya cordata]
MRNSGRGSKKVRRVTDLLTGLASIISIVTMSKQHAIWFETEAMMEREKIAQVEREKERKRRETEMDQERANKKQAWEKRDAILSEILEILKGGGNCVKKPSGRSEVQATDQSS